MLQLTTDFVASYSLLGEKPRSEVGRAAGDSEPELTSQRTIPKEKTSTVSS